MAEVRGLLAAGRRTERLLCRYLADLADRVQARRDPDLGLYADELEAARDCFGLGARETRERVRIGRALRQLPQIDAALVSGQLSYSRVREVTRVATAQTELDWLEVASRLDMRSLERRIAASRAALETTMNAQDGWIATRPEAATPSVRVPRLPTPGTRWVTFELSNGAWELLERAMQAARRASTNELDDGEALEAVARAALSAEVEARALGSRSGAEASEGYTATIRHEDLNAGAREAETTTPASQLDGLGLDPLGGTSASELDRFGVGRHGLGPLGFALQLSPNGSTPGCDPGVEPQVTQRGSTPGCDPGVEPQVTQRGSTPECDPRVEPQVTQRGSTPECDPRVEPQLTQSGSTAKGEPTDNPESVQCGPASRILAAMRRRQRWSLDALTEATGLLAKEVSVALLLLELDGRVRWRDSAYEPV